MSEEIQNMKDTFVQSEKGLAEVARQLIEILQDSINDTENTENMEVYVPLTRQLLDLVTLLTDYSNKELAGEINDEKVTVDYLYDLRQGNKDAVKVIDAQPLKQLLNSLSEILGEWESPEVADKQPAEVPAGSLKNPTIYVQGDFDVDTIVETHVDNKITNAEGGGEVRSQINIDNDQDNDEDIPLKT